MRLVAVLMFATLLAACSGSDRVERIVPAWANTPARGAPQYAAHKSRAGDQGTPVAEPPSTKPAAEPQPARPSTVSHSEE